MMPNNMTAFMQQLQQFRRTFQGDPRQQIQQMLNSGKITQAQYNQAVQQTNQMMQMMKGIFPGAQG